MELTTIKYLSILYVWISGYLGCSFSIFVINYFYSSNNISTIEQCFRFISAGIMTSLATVHLFPDAQDNFITITEFHWAGICVLGGIIFMMLIENIVHGSNHHHHDMNHINIPIESDKNIIKIKSRAILLEIGCVFHSVIIGITLGTVKIHNEESQLITLLIGLCCHQFLEGLGLGAILASAKFSIFKSFIFKMLFSVTAPIGIAIGISMSETYDETSYRANIIQGIFNGISCGLLLYVSLVQLISEDFIHHNLQLKTRFLSIISFCIGSLGMILIAVYGENEEHIEH